MSSLEGYQALLKLDGSIFTTDQAALALELAPSATVKLLRRLDKHHLAQQIAHGYWTVSKDINLADISERLLLPDPSYVSYYSALFQYGMISQIPKSLNLVSTGPARKITTSIGLLTINQLQPMLYGGFSRERQHYIASPEKALFDTIYIAMGRKKRTIGLPEIELPSDFNNKEVLKWVSKIPNQAMQKRMIAHTSSILNKISINSHQVI